MNEEIMKGRMQGYCCSEIIMKHVLDMLGIEDENVMKMSGALCNGMYHGDTCGVLSAAMMGLKLADEDNFKVNEGDILWDWFEETFGSVKCNDLLGSDIEASKQELCPAIIEATMDYLDEILD